MGAFWLILTHDLLEDRPHFYVIWSLILNRCRATWNLSVLWKVNREQLTSTLLTTTEVQIRMNQNLVRNTHKCVFILLLLTPEIRKKIVNLLTGSVTSGPRNGFKFSPAEACMYWSRMDAILAKVPYYIYRGGEIQECFVLFCFFFFSPTKKNFLMALSRVQIPTEWWCLIPIKIFNLNLSFSHFIAFFFAFFSSVRYNHWAPTTLVRKSLSPHPPDPETEAFNVNKMATFHGSGFAKDLLSSLSAEVLYIILSYLPAKSLLNVSECNRRLRDLCQNCNSLWKHLCKVRA